MSDKEVYYSDYLQLDTILNAQRLESVKAGIKADDEMLFIIIHQTYELWFKQILFEVDIVKNIFSQQGINDNSPDLQISVHRLKRVVTILKVLVHQIDVLETMTPLDFLDFRNLLRPASGFQSIQFKILEAALGLKYDQRHGQQYYVSALHKEDIDKVKSAESKKSLCELVNTWLERMPFFDNALFWKNYSSSAKEKTTAHIFWNDYRNQYGNSLLDAEKDNLSHFDTLFLNEKDYPAQRQFSQKANRSALFIMLYRDYPMLQQPFQLLNTLLDIDESLNLWRYRHMNMVHRMIGTRIGTGGSSGKDYLTATIGKHSIFKELAELTSYLIDRHHLPKLSAELEHSLGYTKI
jgi:tryptophan 2,3-dioxygenase